MSSQKKNQQLTNQDEPTKLNMEKNESQNQQSFSRNVIQKLIQHTLAQNAKKMKSALNLNEVTTGYPIRSMQRADGKRQSSSIAAENTVTKYFKYTVFWIDRVKGHNIQIFIELPMHCMVQDCIKEVLPYFNEKMDQFNLPYSLKADPNQFELYYAKKNGKPKSDYPPLCEEQILNQTGIYSLTLCEKEEDCGVNYQQQVEKKFNNESDSDSLEDEAQMQPENDFEGNIFNSKQPENQLNKTKTTFLSSYEGSQILPSKQIKNKNEKIQSQSKSCLCFSYSKKD